MKIIILKSKIMKTQLRKEFYLFGVNTTNEGWVKEGYTVINFGMATKILKENLKDVDFAEEYRDFYNAYQFKEIWEGQKGRFMNNLNRLIEVHNLFETNVFKEKRGGKNHYSVGWENLNSYLQYHSGIFYKWY